MPKMTLNQLQTLTEEELALALYIVNVVEPTELPKMEFKPRHLTWFKRDALLQKFIRAVPKLNPQGFAVLASLFFKLGVARLEIQTSVLCPPKPKENPISTAPSTNTETELPKT
jgi:hypothetical protein